LNHISKTGTKPTGNIPRNVMMLGAVSLLTDAATEMIFPLIPIFVTVLGAGALMLGIIEGAAETTSAMLKLISGIMSDRLRKRKVLVVIGYTISSLIRPLTGLVANAWQIVVIRMLDRVGKGIRTAPRDALIALSVNEHIRGKAYGFHRAMDHSGAIIGPLLAILALIVLILRMGLTDLALVLRWTFILALIPGVFAVLMLIFFVREKKENNLPTAKFSFSVQQFDKNFLTYLSILFLFTLGNSSDAFLLFRVEEAIQASGSFYSLLMQIPVLNDLVKRVGDFQFQRQLTDILFLPLVWAFFHALKAIFSTPLGSWSDRTGRKTVINAGWGIYAFVYMGFALLDKLPVNWQVPATFILFTVYALFYAFSEGAEKALVADLVKPETLGSAFGMYNFTVGLAALPASVIFGFLYKKLGATVAFGCGALIALTAMVLLASLVRKKTSDLRY
jgi:MFS family permease